MDESVLEKLCRENKRLKAKSLMENHLRQLVSEWLEYKGYFLSLKARID